jgi:hypothetical protein
MALKDSQFRAWYRIGNTLRFFLFDEISASGDHNGRNFDGRKILC